MTTLAELCVSVNYGYTASASVDPDTGPKFLRITDIVSDSIDWATVPYCEMEPEKREKYLLKSGDIVVARTGATVGYAKQVWAMPRGATFASYLVRFRPDTSRVDAHYLGQVVQSTAFKRWVKSVASGAAQPNANARLLGSYELPLLPVTAQRRVGSVLRAIEKLIEINRRRVAILEDMARLLYREWFMYFRFPGHEDIDLVDSELGPIPKGWMITCIKDEVTLKRNNIKPYESLHEAFDHYSIPAFDANRRPSIDSGIDIRSGKYLLTGQSILVSKLNPRIPRIWRTDATTGNRRAVASTEFLVLTEPVRWSLAFIYGLVSSSEFIGSLASTAGGTSTSHQRVKPADVMAAEVLDPPMSLVEMYTESVEPMLTLADTLLRQVETLGEARDLLLPRLVSGKLDIPDLELELEAVGM
ncbi:MAG: restriction endonuclease subunit S [Acidimicrobiaceae bacterium]|nr:restriction endonuclease subunit S [Acidimicrobiaceae bacterium]